NKRRSSAATKASLSDRSFSVKSRVTSTDRTGVFRNRLSISMFTLGLLTSIPPAADVSPFTNVAASLYLESRLFVVIQLKPPSQPFTLGGAKRSWPRLRVRLKQTSGGGSSRSSTRTVPTSHCTGLFTWLRMTEGA